MGISARIARTCVQCGSDFQAYRRAVAKGWGRFCTKRCYFASRSHIKMSHGDASGGTISAEYRAWQRMKNRCLNPHDASYSDYGGRGITICPEWQSSFPAFLQAVGRRPTSGHSIDRIDTNLGYFPGNVRWSTATEQQRNKRLTRMLTLDGVTRPLIEWVDVVGLPYSTLRQRQIAGWCDRRILTTPAARWSTRSVQGQNVSLPCLLTFNEETHRLAEWSRITGIKVVTLSSRVKAGWTVEQTLTTPPGAPRG